MKLKIQNIIFLIWITSLIQACTYTERAPEVDKDIFQSTIEEGSDGAAVEGHNSNSSDQGFSENDGPSPKDEPQSKPEVTYTKDILPLLSSTQTGRVFKCTVCHRSYTDYDSVASSEEVDLILLHAGPQGDMPLNGDKLSENDLSLFQTWKELGFPE